MGCSSVFLVAAFAVIANTYGIDEVESEFSPDDTCPPWMMLQDGKCLCRDVFNNLIKRNFIRRVFCDQQTQTTYTSSGTCVTYRNISSIDDLVIGDCPYVPVREQYHYHGFLPLPQNASELNAITCSPFNRQGMLCRSCRPEYGVAIYSIGYPCAKCDANAHLNALWYVLLEVVPITILYVIVIVFRIRATAPPLAGLVFFSHAIQNTLRVRIFIHTKIAFLPNKAIRIGWQTGVFFCSIWSLDFFRTLVPPFCVSENISNIQALLLEYFTAFYPLILVLITFLAIELHAYNVRLFVWLWKPFNSCFANFRRTWDIRYSIVNAFSTFLLLSYIKILSVSFRMLYMSSIYNINGTRIGSALQIDPTRQNFGSNHSGISIMAILIIAVFAILPLLLLLLYPTKFFQKFLRRCTCRAKHAVHLFVDTYQGCLKDGSDGTRDYRSVSALYLILRFALLSLYIRESEITESGLSFILFSLTFIVISIFLVTFKPYKEDKMNYIEFGTLFLLGILSLVTYIWVLFPENGYAVIMIIIVLLPHCVLLCYIAYVIGRGRLVLNWIRSRLPAVPNKGNSEGSHSITGSLTLTRLLNSFTSDDDSEELPDRLLNPGDYPQALTTGYKLSIDEHMSESST